MKTENKEDVRLVVASNEGSEIEAEYIIDILQQEQIEAFMHLCGDSVVANLYLGGPRYGVDIIVSEDDLEKAKKIINSVKKNIDK